MTQLQQQIAAVQQRQQRQWMGKCLTWGTLISGGLACMLGLVRLLSHGAIGWGWIVAICGVGPLIGVIYSWFTKRPLRGAAMAIDSACNLQDRTVTAMQFQQAAQSSADITPLHRLQIADAEAHANRVQIEHVVPKQRLRALPIAVSLSAVAILLAIVSGPRTELMAASVTNDVVQQQASRVEEGLEELESLQDEQDDPAMEDLLKDLQKIVEQLKEPGTDPKEALAKLSEMEASLQQMQKVVDDPAAAADLQQIGEALSLSEAMASAGAALSNGDMEKAAQELDKLELPDLDRKTEKAVTEKLEKMNQSSGQGNAKRSVQQAAAKISQGISQGNRGKFNDGVNGLAKAARKQSRRKKLSLMLRKQCKCLSECKGECECECRKQCDASKNGGTKAGSAASGNPSGDKTPKLKTQPQMNLKGRESTQGDTEIETQSSDPQQQAAARAYEQKAEKYEALSESVLESESIPLGHRQTIRKYFEMIRPTSSETDAVNQSIEGQ